MTLIDIILDLLVALLGAGVFLLVIITIRKIGARREKERGK
jgi:hypothetical protein